MKEEKEASLKSPLTSMYIASFWEGGVRMRPNTIKLRDIVSLVAWTCPRVVRMTVALHVASCGGARRWADATNDSVAKLARGFEVRLLDGDGARFEGCARRLVNSEGELHALQRPALARGSRLNARPLLLLWRSLSAVKFLVGEMSGF